MKKLVVENVKELISARFLLSATINASAGGATEEGGLKWFWQDL